MASGGGGDPKDAVPGPARVAEAAVTNADSTTPAAAAGRTALKYRLSNVERLIYRNKSYLEAELRVTDSMLEEFQTRNLFPEDKIAELRGVLHQHNAAPLPCPAVNRRVVAMVLRLTTDFLVDRFLACLEIHQKEIPWKILRGKTLEQISSGFLCGSTFGGGGPLLQQQQSLDSSAGSHGSAALSLTSSATSQTSTWSGKSGTSSPPPEVDYDTYPEPDVDFDQSEFYETLEEEDMDVGGSGKVEIGPGGGTFKAESGDVEVSIPRDALTDVHEVFVLEAPICKTSQTDTGPVYMGKAVYLSEHGLQLARPATVTIRDNEANLKLGLKVCVFASNTDLSRPPEFSDVTDLCRPAVNAESGTIAFEVSHFSFYVYAIVAAVVPAATVGLLLQNQEARISLYAETPDTSVDVSKERVRLLLTVVPPGVEPKKIPPHFHLVTSIHRRLLLARFEVINVSLAPADDNEATSAVLPWKFTDLSSERLEDGLLLPDRLTPILVRNQECPAAVDKYPFAAALRCRTDWFGSEALVEFEIDPTLLRRWDAARPAPVAALERQPPPPPCPGNHTDDAKKTMMTRARKRALEVAMVYLANDSHSTTIDVMTQQLVCCGVLHLNSEEYNEIRLPSLIAQKQMRRMVEYIHGRHNAAFDCFCHAVEHVFIRPHFSKLMRDEEQKELSKQS